MFSIIQSLPTRVSLNLHENNSFEGTESLSFSFFAVSIPTTGTLYSN